MSQIYSLNVTNYSRKYGSFCVYQTAPDIDDPRLMSLGWLVTRAHPTTRVSFQWSIDYSFVWAETGLLVPGVVFDASQNRRADLTTSNSIDFTAERGEFTFANQVTGGNAGTLYVHNSSAVPFDMASVGIGMSGAGTFVKQAQPNLTYAFTPNPVYWVVFGDYEPGEVLDLEDMVHAQRIDFSPGVYHVDATLNLDNTWSVR